MIFLFIFLLLASVIALTLGFIVLGIGIAAAIAAVVGFTLVAVAGSLIAGGIFLLPFIMPALALVGLIAILSRLFGRCR